MLNHLFNTILSMSLTAAVAILAVLPVSAILKKIKAPAIICYVLWAVILFRLLCPITFSSPLSLYGWAMPAEPTHIAKNITAPQPLFPQQNANAIPAPTDLAPATEAKSPALPSALALVWLGGALILLVYHSVSYLRLKRAIATADHVAGNVYHSGLVSLPFVCGLLHPRIYLPLSIGEKEYGYILLHEQIHVMRRDYLVKPLWLAACCLHWFNPLVWLAFSLMCADMELSCDEAVLKKLGNQIKLDYSRSLLAQAATGPTFGGAMPAFGRHRTKERVKHILNYKKPAIGVLTLAVLMVTITACALATNAPPPLTPEVAEEPEAAPDEYRLSDEAAQRLVEEKLANIQAEIAAQGEAQEKIRELLAGRTSRQFYIGAFEAGILSWPYTGAVTQVFGARSLGYHSGIDIQGPIGDAVTAAEAGTVVFAGWNEGYGNCVIIDHQNDMTTTYGHLSAFAVEPDDTVARGQLIGNIGSTGQATGPQVHFEVRIEDVPYDPLLYLENNEEPAEV